jgi:predicted RNA-binding protein
LYGIFIEPQNVLIPRTTKILERQMKKYRNGIYHVTVLDKNGTIKVKAGDWISKYSAAIYNDFTRLEEFGRLNGEALPSVIVTSDKIFSGETIYHLADFYGQKNNTKIKVSRPTQKTIPKLTDAEKKKIILDTLQSDFELRGENLKVLSSAIDILGKTGDVMSLLEIATALETSATFATISGNVGLIATLLSPLANIAAVMNAHEAGERMYGLRAVAYTIVAWAFDKPIPQSSPKIMYRLKHDPAESIARRKKAWMNASKSALVALRAEAKKRKVNENSLKLLYRALGQDNAKTLCLSIMKGLESKLSPIEKITWNGNLKVLYPD